jgi:hemolysin activation/secretion protein
VLALLSTIPVVAAQPDEAAGQRFDIWEYRIEGNTLLGAERIEGAVSPYLGPQRLIGDVNEAAANLERAYRDAGYPTIFVDVPEQDVVGGIVTLAVTEGRLDRVRIEGSRYFTLSGIRHRMQSLESGKPLHVPTMQKELSALNALSPDMKVVPVLKPGKTRGAVDLDLKVSDQRPLHGMLEVNNYNSANTSDTRFSAAISYDNLWQKQHSLGLQWQTSPENMDEVDVFVGTYIAPWFDTNNRVALYFVNSNSDIASVGDINVVGDGRIYGARFVIPMPSDRTFVHSLSFGADYKDYSEIIRLDPANKISTPIDYLVWSLQYNASQFAKSSQTQWTLGANFGVRGVGNEDSEFIDKRNKSRSNFAYLRATMNRTDFLPADWQLGSLLRAQMADSALINNEQFGAGGVDSVRGYYESQALGDQGASLGFELRTPHLLKKIESISELRLLAFVEGAHLTVTDALPDQDNEINLASVGLGMTLRALRQFELSIDWGWALRDSGEIESGDDRINAGLEWKF